MDIKNFLDASSANARAYIRNSIKSKSKEDFNKIKKLFIDKKFESKSFEDSDLDIIAFDWQSLDRDRNWWWQLQALPFLNWYTNSFLLQTEEERLKYFSVCLDAINCWINFAQQDSKSPLAWHDHAAAFRVRNLTNWLLFCHVNALPLTEDSRAKSLASLIDEHLVWLGGEKNYSKHTNHGFDQAMIALTIGLMFERDEFEPYRVKNRERLKDEVNFAFTNQGVHKENSPGYQKMMLTRLKQLRVLAQFGENNISQMVECYINNAEDFLRVITLPNGYLPMIGDTRGGDEGLLYQQTKKVDVLDYSASGYVIIRGFDGLDKEFFILFKNTHESNYHRHDDDMMIYLFYDGEVVLGDGGLYKHQEEDDRRKHLRSHFSHSVPYLRKKAVRNKDRLLEAPSILREGEFEFTMTSTMFDIRIKRNIEVRCDSALEILINDSLEGDSFEPIWANFFMEKKNPINIRESSLEVRFSSFTSVFNYLNSSQILLEAGHVEGSIGSIVSRQYGEIDDAFRFAISSSKLSINFY